MPPHDRDAASLWDMVQAIQQIYRFMAGSTYKDFSDSELIQRAIERDLEILGEAARRISIDFQHAHSEIDWRNIIGLRNLIVHRYDQVRLERIWAIVTSELPQLLAQLQPLLPPLPEEQE
jgi:uncharacterized protein with HEPN domain